MKTQGIIQHIIFLLISAIMVLPSGCGVPNNSKLLSIESIMEEHPDSALCLLDSISPLSLSGTTESSLYHLLISQAKYKNYIPIPSDSAISLAVEHFGSFPVDRPRLMRSLYYRSLIRRQLNANKAETDAFKASGLAREINDPLWVARTSDLIAEIYYENYQWDEALPYIDTAIVNYQKAGKTLNKFYCLLQKGTIFTDKCQYSRSLEVIDSVIGRSEEWDNDSLFMSHCLDASLSPLIYSGRYADARILIDKRVSYPFSMSCHSLMLCAIAYHETGDQEKAFEYLNAAYDSALSHEDKAEIIIMRQKLGQNYSNERIYHTLADSVTLCYNKLSNLALNNSSKFLQSVAEHGIESERNLSSIRKIIITILTAIICVTVGLYLHISIQNRKKNNYIKNIKSISSDLFGSHFQTVNRLCDEYLSETDSDADRLKIYKRIKTEILNIGDSKNLKGLILWVDTNKDGKLSEFFNQMPDLTFDEKKIITFVIAGFSPKTISLFMDLKYKTFYTRLGRIKKRIEKTNTPLTHWILDSLSLRK